MGDRILEKGNVGNGKGKVRANICLLPPGCFFGGPGWKPVGENGCNLTAGMWRFLLWKNVI